MGEDKTTIFLCPACGAFISGSAKKCPHCGESLEGYAEEEPVREDPSSVEEEVNLLELELAVAEALPEEAGEPVTLFLCSECGAFTGGSATFCPNCGASMQEESGPGPEPEPEPAEKPEGPLPDLMAMLVEAAPEDRPEPQMEELAILEADESGISVDSIPGQEELAAPDDVPLEMSELDDLILGSLPTRGEQDGAIPGPVEDDAGDTREADAEPARPRTGFMGDETVAICRSCGAFVPETGLVCNVCGESIEGAGKIIPEPEQPRVQGGAEAESTLRSMFGIAEDAVLDDDAGSRFQSDGSIGLCTVCGAFIGKDSRACGVCGTHIEDMPEFVPSMDVIAPEKADHGLAVCPHCGVFVQEGATECLSCVKPIPGGARVEQAAHEPEQEGPDRATEILKSFLRVEKLLELTPSKETATGSLDICPDCGAFVSMNAIVCSICGAPLFEGAEDIAEIDARLSDETGARCPNCGGSLPAGAAECPDCLFAFAPPAAARQADTDVSDIAEMDLDAPKTDTLSTDAHDAAHGIPGTGTEPTMGDELESLIVSEMLIDELVTGSARPREPEGIEAIGPGTDDAAAMPPDEIPGLHEPEPAHADEPDAMTDEIGELESQEPEPQPGHGPNFDSGEIAEPEVLEFIGEEQPAFASQPAQDEMGDGDTLMVGEELEPVPAARDLSKFDSAAPGAPKSGNWSMLVYVSVAAICFFAVSYTIEPGEYAPGLAVIFGTFSLFGAILAFTEKGTLFTGDARHASIFLAGVGVAAAMLVLLPMWSGMPGEGVLSQAGFATIMFSISVLLVSIGLLWIRARVRYIFTWSGGNLLLFLGTLLDFTRDGWFSGMMSPVVLVSGLGAGLVIVSLIFLLYEKALNTSIESDIVRGDAHYLRRDYRKALASYDDALSKAQIRKVDVIGSPLVEYDVPWYSKGSALILMGEFEEGIRCLDMALAINPNNEVTWVSKGNAHTKLGEHDLAMDCYRRAIEVNPFYEIALNNLGNTFARQKDYMEALRHYNRALKINPRYDDAWINKGYVLAKMGRRDAAVKCLDHVGSRARGKPAPVERDAQSL